MLKDVKERPTKFKEGIIIVYKILYFHYSR